MPTNQMVYGEQKVGEVVATDYRTADIFKKYDIDFYCGGVLTIEEVCSIKQIEQGVLLEALAQALSIEENNAIDYNSKSLRELIDIINNQHHVYIRKNTPSLQECLRKTYTVHGQNHPELGAVLSLFLQSSHELSRHMQKEEYILFPYIRKMEAACESGVHIEKPDLTSVIEEMLNEHENEGARFDHIRELTNNFQIPDDACDTYKETFKRLKEFQDDLHLHMHLENNILMPKSIRLQNELFPNNKPLENF